MGSQASGRVLLRVVDGELYPDWQAVYLDNVVGVYRLVFARVGNRPDAEDLTAEVFLATLRTLRLPSPRHEVRSYLVTTARTKLADHWRRRYAAPEIDADLEALTREPEAALSEVAEERAHRLLGALPVRFRVILELRFLRGYSVREAAREMGVTEANAKVLQHRALRLAARAAEEAP